jgi:hypothetical protein
MADENHLLHSKGAGPRKPLALALLCLVVGAVAGFVGALFRIGLHQMDFWRTLLIGKAHALRLGWNYRCSSRHCAACRSCLLDGSPNRAGILGKRQSVCENSVARRLGRQSPSHHHRQICWWNHGHWRRLGLGARGSNNSDRRSHRTPTGQNILPK